MRTKFEKSPNLFTLPISGARFPKNCRDEAPKLLKGLQAIFENETLNKEIFNLLNRTINSARTEKVNSGRKGMGLWEILVLAVMRQGLNCNYDKIHYLANTDVVMRTIMGIETLSHENKKEYGLTTIKDNVSLLSTDTIIEINNIVVSFGHSLLKKEEDALHIKADSFPVGANVHFPTDLNLLWDSARKCIDISEWLAKKEGGAGWRKHNSWRREIKKLFRNSSKASSSGGKNKQERLEGLVTSYLQLCKKLQKKVENTVNNTKKLAILSSVSKRIELEYYLEMLIKHIDLVYRRIIKFEKIDSSEKLFSIFETHAEWLTKGKKFTPVEIGHNVLIATDQFNFIVHHQVAFKQADAHLTKELAMALVELFPSKVATLSLDKGFYSKENKEFVKQLIPFPVMPKKGKRNKEETKEERNPKFVKYRNAHSAVESNINQLEHNGLGRCPDRGIDAFKKYTALSVLAYNFHKVGEHLQMLTNKKAA